MDRKMLRKTNSVVRGIADHYDKVVEQYVDVFFEDLTDAPWLDRMLSYLAPPAKLLDVGCGPGNFSRYIVNRGHFVTGVDISLRMVETARNLVPEASFMRMNMSNLTFSASSFDAVLAAYSFLHLPSWSAHRVLRGFWRVLKPGGLLCLMVKLGEGERELPSPLVQGERCYVKLWDAESLVALITSCGFSVVEFDRSGPQSAQELQFEKLFILAETAKFGSRSGLRPGQGTF